MNNFLLAIAGLIIAVFAAGFAVPYFLDWNDYRPEIEKQLSGLVGQEIKVGGDINIRLLPRPFMHLNDVRVLDSFPGATKPFAKIEKFTLWLSAPSLLSGQLSAQKLKLLNPVLNLVVDGQGRGNWEEFNTKKERNLNANIEKIALQDAQIENGQIVVHSLVDKGNEIFKTPALSGSLSAHSLSGPYKFKGHLEKKSGSRSLVNFSTGRKDDAKGMLITAFLQNKIEQSSYQLSSRVKAISGGKLSYTGTIHAKMPFESLLLSDKKVMGLRGRVQDKKEPLEITATLEGAATRAKLDNIKFSLVRQNRPQALKGAVQLDWSQGDLQAVGHFKARFLDFDLMGSDVEQDFNHNAFLAQLPRYIYDFGHRFHRADFSVQLDQIKIGGEAVQNLEGSLQKTLRELTISNMTAKLPASSYLSLSGKIEKEAEQSVIFAGPLVIQGQNIGHFQNWIVAKKEKSALNKPFIFASEVIAGKGQVKLTDIEGDLAGRTIRGEVVSQTQGEKPMIVKLDMANMDVAELLGKEVSLKDLVQKQGRDDDKSLSLPLLENMSVADLEKRKAQISLRVGALTLSDTVLNDFYINLDFGLKDKRLKQFSFITKEGLRVVLDGALLSKKMKMGQKLNMRVETLASSAVSQLTDLLALDNRLERDDVRLELIHPVSLNFGIERQDEAQGYRLLINGQAQESEIFAYGYMGILKQKEKLKKGKDSLFSQSNLDLKISVTNPDGVSLLKQFVTNLAVENLAEVGKGKGSLNIQLVGMPKQGMQTEIFGALPGLKLTAVGKVKIEDGKNNFAGPITLEAKNMSQGLALLDLGLQVKPDAGGLVLSGNLVKTDGLYDLSNISGKIGGSDIYGVAHLDKRAKKPIFNLSLTAQTANLVSILEPNIAWFRSQKGKKIGRETIWTGERFDLALLQGFKGKFSLKTKQMEMGQGLILEDAILTAQYGDGQLNIDELSGKAFGGAVQSAFKMQHGRAVTTISGAVKVVNAELKQLFPEKGDVLASGKANLTLDYSGKGRSPKTILSLMKGKGQLELIDTQFNYIAPSAIQDIAQEKKGGADEDVKTFEQRFAEHLSTGQFNVGAQIFDLKITDGVVELKTDKMEDDGVALSVKTYLSLATLGLDSEWRLKTGKGISPKNMPAVELQFAGKLAELGKMKPVYKVKALESFLSVLKIEKDVDRLEDLNSKLEKAAQKEKADREALKAQAGEQASDPSEAQTQSGVTTSPLENLPTLSAPSAGVEVLPLNDL